MPEYSICHVTLSEKEKAISLISNAIASYSLYTKKGSLPENLSLIDFVLRAVPEEIKPYITMELIDEVFGYVSKTRMDDS